MSSPKPRNCYHKLQGQYRIAASSYIPETTFVFVGPDKFPSGNVRARIYAVEKREDLPFTLGDPDGDGSDVVADTVGGREFVWVKISARSRAGHMKRAAVEGQYAETTAELLAKQWKTHMSANTVNDVAWDVTSVLGDDNDADEDEEAVHGHGAGGSPLGASSAGAAAATSMVVRDPIRLSQYDGKDLNTFLTLVGLWRSDNAKAGQDPLTSTFLNALPATARKGVLGKVPDGKTIDTIGMDAAVAFLVEWVKGTADFKLINVLEMLFVYRRKDGVEVADHCAKVAEIRKDCNAVMAAEMKTGTDGDGDGDGAGGSSGAAAIGTGAPDAGAIGTVGTGAPIPEAFPSRFWGWYTFFSFGVPEADRNNLVTLVRSNFSPRNVRKQLESYYRKDAGSTPPATEKSLVASSDEMKWLKGQVSALQRQLGNTSSKPEVAAAVGGGGKGKGKGKRRKWKARCRDGDACKNPKCEFFHRKDTAAVGASEEDLGSSAGD